MKNCGEKIKKNWFIRKSANFLIKFHNFSPNLQYLFKRKDKITKKFNCDFFFLTSQLNTFKFDQFNNKYKIIHKFIYKIKQQQKKIYEKNVFESLLSRGTTRIQLNM